MHSNLGPDATGTARGLSPLVLAHPLGLEALPKRKRVKTDPADASELANLLRLGSLPEAHIAPRGARAAGVGPAPEAAGDGVHRGQGRDPGAAGPTQHPTVGDPAVKGIGPMLAAVFVAETGDIDRFPTAAPLCCWAGLIPRHGESDKTVPRGHVSKERYPLVRWASVEASQR